MKTKHPSYCCQKCGELIGWIGRVLPFHKCKEKNMNSLPRYNEKAELDTRLRVDPVTGDVGIGTPQRTWVKLTDEDMNNALDYWSDNSRSSYGGAHAANGEYVDMIETWRYIEAKLKEKNT